MTERTGYMEVLETSNVVFLNSTTEDLVIYTETSNQGILIGTTQSNLPNIALRSNNTSIYGRLAIGSSNPGVALEVNDTDAMLIPKGTSAQRPSVPQQGHIRYNTTTGSFEGYGQGNTWGSLGGGGSATSLKDTNLDTYISVESFPTSNDDTIKFYTSNIETLTLTSNQCIVRVPFNLSNYGIIGTTFFENTDSNARIGNEYIVSTANSLGVNYALFQGSNGATTLNSASNQPLIFSIGNTERMRILTNSNVGIGTTTPAETLHVAGKTFTTNQVLGYTGDTSNIPAFSWTDDSNTGIYHPAVDTIGIVNNGIETVRITSVGNVGIGTQIPNYLCDVNGNLNATTLYEGTTLLATKYAPSNTMSSIAIYSSNTAVSACNMSVYASNVGVQNSNILTPTVATTLSNMTARPLGFGTATNMYPPVNFTSNATTTFTYSSNVVSGQAYGNGTYVTTVSVSGNIVTSLFDGASLYWYSGSYNANGTFAGTTSTTVSGSVYNGDWFQLRLPTRIRLTSYMIKPPPGLTEAPDIWVIAGSSNGSTWDFVDTKTNGSNTFLSSATTYTINVTTPLSTAYDYYRFIGIKSVNRNYMGVDEWRLLGNEENQRQINFWMNGAAGYLGIGTSNPQEALHVTGKVFTTNQVLGYTGDTSNVPAFSWTDDSNTGIYHPAVDTIAFTNNGIERVRITSNGNVGIGTSNPLYSLHVSNVAYIPDGIISPGIHAQSVISGGGTVTWSNNYLYWSSRILILPCERSKFSTDGYFDVNCPTSGTIAFYNAASVLTTVTCTANGIPMNSNDYLGLFYEVTPGQTFPSDPTKLRLVHYANSIWRPSTNWIVLCTLNADTRSIRWFPGCAYIPNNSIFYCGTSTNNWQINGTTNYIPKFNAANTITANSLIYDNATNVGVGNNNPQYKLDVTGTFRTTSNIRCEGDLTIVARNETLVISPGLKDNAATTGFIQYDIPGTGTHYFWDNLQVNNSFSAASKSFCIPHPLFPSEKALIHACVEAPSYELIYSGSTYLSEGKASVAIDIDSCRDSPMDPGTFMALTKNHRIFLQNNETFDRTKGRIQEGILYIECENSLSTAKIDWLVVAERCDPSLSESRFSNSNGALITQLPKSEVMLERPSAQNSNL